MSYSTHPSIRQQAPRVLGPDLMKMQYAYDASQREAWNKFNAVPSGRTKAAKEAKEAARVELRAALQSSEDAYAAAHAAWYAAYHGKN